MLVLTSGARVMESLKAFQKAEHVSSGSLTGVGVTRNTVLGFYRFNADGTPGKTHMQDTVKDPREIVALTCNFTSLVVEDGKPDTPAPPHCHIALAGTKDPVPDTGRGWPVVGGHLIEAEVAVTAELIISTYPTSIVKRPSRELGGILVDISEKQKGVPLFVEKK